MTTPTGSLVFIGLGLGDLKDVTLRGLEEIKSSDFVFLENYTAILPGCEIEDMEKFYGKQLIVADRDMVESASDKIIEKAENHKVSLLVVGDPFCATTHSDLYLRAKSLGIAVSVVHNASIISAIGCTGIHIYRLGEIITVPFWMDNWKPDSFYDKIKINAHQKLHTLCLLDIKVKERSIENLIKGRDIFEPPRFMTVRQALEQLTEIETNRKEGIVTEDTFVIGVARVGKDDQTIKFGTVKQMMREETGPTCRLGGPLHSLVICGELHEMEKEFLDQFQC
jgi:diphthine methyl ester synthase